MAGMIIKGGSRSSVSFWSKHLQDLVENERMSIPAIHDLAADNIDDLFREIEGHAAGTRAKNFMWVALLNPGPGDRQLTDAEWDRAREILEEERGLQGQPYFVVEHEKNGYRHRHIIWSRIDLENARALPDGMDAKVCHTASEKIRNELDLEHIPSPLLDRDRDSQAERRPEDWEMYRGMKTGIDPRDITRQVTELQRQSDSGQAFKAALEAHGYELVTGDRGLLILDSAGKEHSLVRRIEGMNKKQVDEFMRDVDRAALPTLEQAQENFQQRKIDQLEADRATVAQEIEWEEKLYQAAIEKEKIERRFAEPEHREGETRRGVSQDIELQTARLIADGLWLAAIHDPELRESIKALAEYTDFRDEIQGVITSLDRLPRDVDLRSIEGMADRLQRLEFQCADIDFKLLAIQKEKQPAALVQFSLRSDLEEKRLQMDELNRDIFVALVDLSIRHPELREEANFLSLTKTAFIVSDRVDDLDKVQAQGIGFFQIENMLWPQIVQHDLDQMNSFIADELTKAQDRDPETFARRWRQGIPDAVAAEFIKRGREQQARDQAEPPHVELPPIAPELGKTQGDIRLAFSLTSSPVEALNALEDRGYIVSKITQADIDKELEKLREEWEERRRNPQHWMEHSGGYKELSPVFQQSAERSFDEWQEARQKKDPNLPDLDPEQEEKALHAYVEYVQGKWAEGPTSQLERAIGGLVAVTPYGSVYTFTPRNTGIDDRDELAEHLKAIDREPLLSVTDAQDVMRDVQEQRRHEWQDRRPLNKTDGQIRLAFSLTQTGQEFADALEDRGFIVTIASPDDVAMHDRRAHIREYQRNETLKAWGIDPATRKPEPETPIRVGDFLVVDPRGNYHPLTDRNTGPESERQARLEEIQLSPLPSVIEARAVMRDYHQHRLQEWDQQRRDEWLMKQPLGKVDGDIRLAASLTQGGQEFADALEDRGYILSNATSADIAIYERQERSKQQERAERLQAQGVEVPATRDHGEQRSYVGELMVVDPYGTIHRLTDRNTGRAADEREAWLSEVDRGPLPSVILARAMMNDYRQHRQQERIEKQNAWYADAESQLDPITLRFAHSDRLDVPQQRGDILMQRAEANISYGEDRDQDYKFKPGERQQRDRFRDAMENSGVAFAVVTPDEAYRSHREAQFTREIGRRSTAFDAGEIVVVTDRNVLYQRDGAWDQAERVFKIDQAQADNYLQLLEFDKGKLRGIDETKTILDGKREERAAYWQDLRDESFFWSQFYEPVAKGKSGDIKTALRAFAGSTAAALDTVAKGFDIVASIFDSIFAPKLSPAQIHEAELSREDREIDAQHSAMLSNRTAELAQQRQNEQEQQAARDRQRELDRER